MSDSSNGASRHDIPPEAALVAVQEYKGPVLLDLDETVYLRNSTEDFLDSACPGLFALLLLRFLDVTRPWRWTGGEATRDIWRVRVVSVFNPWISALWRRRVTSLAEQFANRPLLEAVARRSGPSFVITVGFQPIVTPLIEALGFSEQQIVASRLTTAKDRLRGKLATAIDAVGEEVVANGLVLTDSLDDLPLLDRCARPLRTIWQGAQYRRALNRVYLPGEYLSQIKRPGQRYIRHGVLLGDFPLWVCCSILYAESPVSHAFGLLSLLISFWAIYERGYVDNDLMALHHERDPRLSDTFGKTVVATPPLRPWVWAAVFGIVGVLLLRGSSEFPTGALASWAGILLGTHFCFRLYNRWDKESRIWLYLVLQVARAASFTVLVAIDLFGTLALCAHVIARWVPYYIYRTTDQWPDAPSSLMRLVFYILLWGLSAITQDLDPLVTPTALLLLVWFLFRARKEMRQRLAAIRRIDRAESS